MGRYPRFDVSHVRLRPLAERGHDLRAADCLPLAAPPAAYGHPDFPELVRRIKRARRDDRPVILFTGAHPIKLGLSRFLVDLVERRMVTHLATNGAGLIHDYELAVHGGTSENVARWLAAGQFGLWRETGRLNDLAVEAASRDEGLGETVGRTLVEQAAPHGDLSLAAAGWRSGVPMTVHVSLGSDIVHAHPNCCGAAWGRASMTDFLIFAHTAGQLEGGVLLNVGSAIAGPEVFLKALSMARNAAAQEGRTIAGFTTAVFDLVELPDGWNAGPPMKDHPLYYYRPWKTLLCRSVSDGGESFYFRGDHRQTIPTLWQSLVE